MDFEYANYLDVYTGNMCHKHRSYLDITGNKWNVPLMLYTEFDPST